MKFKIQAGAEIEAVTPSELDDRLGKLSASWMTELARGVKFRQISGQGNVAGGIWTIGLTGDQIRPRPGFIWGVTRVCVSGGGFVAGTDTYSIFRSDVQPSKLIVSGLTRAKEWQPNVFVLNENDSLIATGVGTGAVAPFDVNVSGDVVELPVQLAWQLL